MAEWTAEARQLYKKEHPENFAGPDLSFPIKDEADVKNAWDLAGHSGNPTGTRSKVKSIAKRLGLSHSLPASANMSDSNEIGFIRSGDTAIFSIGEEAVKSGNLYTRTGKIFEVGDYPDKDFSLTTEEAKAAVAAFQPIPNRGAHVPTIFDGKMGMLEKVELAEDGVTLNGTISVPEWLQSLHGADNALMGSLEWDRTTKRIAGSTLIPNPRVADSAMMAAFTAAENPGDKTNVVSFMDALKTMLGLDKPTETVPPTVVTPVKVEEPVKMSVTESPEVAAMRKQIEELQKKNRTNEAEKQVAALFTDRRVMPAQTKALIAVFEVALGLDQTANIASFSDEAGKEQKLGIVEALKAVFAAGPQHSLTLELVPSNENLVVLSNGSTDKDDPDGAKEAASKATAWAKKQEGVRSGS